ncbi:circadian clock-controlled protein daywake-like [Teleopsis dalmanni]|uniref:circadian clock-controlled protein daywake-like n=1 Tax=Teleopsis dalmanni TaxID=139649 RepID=UPI0018CC89EE|nr:circadian clock-controlled protein daywake-like [Teleopsis dalmanni]
MNNKIILCALVLIYSAFTSSDQHDDYLKDPPEFWKPCTIRSNVDEKCFGKILEQIFKVWKNGVPGAKEVGTFDPLTLKKARLSTQRLGDLQFEFNNLEIYGLSSVNAYKSSVDPNDYTFVVHMKFPSMKLVSDYKLKGQILVLALDAEGVTKADTKDFDMVMTIKSNLKKRLDEYFFDVLSVSTEIKGIKHFQVHFTNLFHGQKELEDSANAIFNDNWPTLFEELRPAVEKIFDTVTIKRLTKLFNYIPARYFISDLS